LELIYDSGMKAFPARLPQQPIFYPVLDLEYARQTASDWNAKNGQFAGYVTQFKMEEPYIDRFELHTVGGTQYQEFWIPVEELEEFNKHITGHIKVVEAHFGEAFQGFVPDRFGLEGKHAVEQFTLLANSYVYKRMDFYLEIKRNHKAIFLNYPFWQRHEFKNQGLKEKVLQAIREAWLTSFPKTPLPQTPIPEEAPPVKQKDAPPLAEPVDQNKPHTEQTKSQSFVNPAQDKKLPVKSSEPHPLVKPVARNIPLVSQTQAPAAVSPDRETPPPVKQTESNFAKGIQLGLAGQYHEAIEKLSKAVEEDHRHVIAYTSLGVAFHKSGDDDRALACYDSALKIDLKNAEAHYFRANILYSQGNAREAIAEYTTAMGLAPELIEAHQKDTPEDRLTDYTRTPAEMYWIAKPAQRILELNKSIESSPRQGHFLKERAAEYSRLMNYEQAIADYSSSLAIQPDDANAHHFRGLAYEQIGQPDRALDDYQRSITIDPQLSSVYVNRGVAFGQMGHFRQSIASLTEAIRLAPRNPDGYFNRGMTYIQQGDFEKAISDFSRVIELSSNDEAAYYWRGISNEETGRRSEAVADYRQFLALTRDANARQEIEGRLGQLDNGKPKRESRRSGFWSSRQKSNQIQTEEVEQTVDLHRLIVALGERAVHSTWFGSGVDCYGEKAEELYAYADHNKPIEGQVFFHITSGIQQTMMGDFQAFEPDADSPWIFIRAWEGSGFYIETNDPKVRKHLKKQFKRAEDIEDATPSYEGMFIRV
jgi:tetratricopeptide (TPR) repeat protein